MTHAVAPWIALAFFAGAITYRASAWFRNGLAPGARAIPAWSRLRSALHGLASTVFSARLFALLEALLLDVLLQRRLLKENAVRWLAHLCLFGAFMSLLLVHALAPLVTARLLPGYEATLNPFLLLRDLLGAVLLAGLAVAVHRRLFPKSPRRDTRPSDSFALALIAVIVVSGFLLEAAKIGSYERFRGMVREYAQPSDEAALAASWVEDMGMVAPGSRATPELVARGREIHAASCAACHSPARSGFMGYAVAGLLRPVAPRLDALGVPAILSAIHFYACLIGLALLPFTKLFHVVATPICLMASAVTVRGRSDPANVATKQMVELDACTHCCACSAHCSMAATSDVVRNGQVLPSEKMAALKMLASGRDLGPALLRSLQEGVCLCTGCDRCTVACPSGIDLLGLWTCAREALLARGEPEYALLSPLSLRRGLMQAELDPAAYRDAVERPRRALAAHFDFAALDDRSAVLTPGDGRLWRALRGSPQSGSASSCVGCKTCTTACPVVRDHVDAQPALGLLPHQVLYAARLGLAGLVLGSRMLWDCLGCYQCQELCPQGVAVADVMYELKNVAIAQATGREVRRSA